MKKMNEETRSIVLAYVRNKIRSHVTRFEFESNSLECWFTISAADLRDWIASADLEKLSNFIEIRDGAPHVKRIVFERTSNLAIRALLSHGRLEYVEKRECGWAQGEQKRADLKPEGKRNGGKAGHRSDYSFVNGNGQRVRVEVKHRGAWFLDPDNDEDENE